MSGAMTTERPERNERLWLLAASPLIWAAHFLASYCTAAIWCARFVGPDKALSSARLAIAVYTILALIGVAIIGWHGFKRDGFGGSHLRHDIDSPLDRHRFLGFMTLLLSGLSAVAVIYTALAAVFIGSCY